MRALALVAALAVACSPPAPVGAPSPSVVRTEVPSASPQRTAAPSASPSPAPTGIPKVQLERAFGNASFVNMTGAFQSSSGRWYVLEQAGRILTFTGSDPRPVVFLDISGRIQSGGEEGLLGFAFAPDFDRSGVFFLDYTMANPRRTVIASFTSTANSAGPSTSSVANLASEAVLLEIMQPFPNHKGGQLAFGPDGYLYIAMGDGGSGGDPFRNGQNPNALLGKILRIDVKDRTKYAVPPDNPFAAGGGRGEIYAYGLRNPWRFAFDGNDLWVADVGQDLFEEIDLVTKGGNYGWNVMEGKHCYNAKTCDAAGMTPPIFEYGHDAGACSITGGFVYRGSDIPELRGAYVYGDYCNGRIWALRYGGGQVAAQSEILASGFQVSSFAQDQKGELYVLQYAGTGGFFRIVR
jgi:glucose/arabinose dehydrogenase